MQNYSQQNYQQNQMAYAPQYNNVQQSNIPNNDKTKWEERPHSPFKYPRQIDCVKRDDCNFYVEPVFRAPTEQELIEGIFPGMSVFGKTRFDFYIFKYEEKKSIKFCLSVKDIRLLHKKTEAIIAENAIPKKKKNEDKLPSAYTLKLRGGATFSGKTAAQILVENPSSRDDLLRQRDYYMSNASHPKFGRNNKAMANAINEAVILLDNHQLDPSKLMASSFAIEDLIKTPNNKKLDSRGLTETRRFCLNYLPGESQPFVVEITNCYAPPADGLVGAKLQQAVDSTTWRVAMTETEWYFFIDQIYRIADAFERMMEKKKFQSYYSEPEVAY